MIDFLRKNWFLISVFGFCLAFGSKLMAVWDAPNKINEYEKAQNRFYTEQQAFTAEQRAYIKAQQEINEQNAEWQRLLTQAVLKENDGH